MGFSDKWKKKGRGKKENREILFGEKGEGKGEKKKEQTREKLDLWSLLLVGKTKRKKGEKYKKVGISKGGGRKREKRGGKDKNSHILISQQSREKAGEKKRGGGGRA